jgi:hypothetical protein
MVQSRRVLQLPPVLAFWTCFSARFADMDIFFLNFIYKPISMRDVLFFSGLIKRFRARVQVVGNVRRNTFAFPWDS